MMTKPRTVIYARQSRDLLASGLAVTRQVALSEELIKARNLGATLEPILENDVSATTKKVRPGYQRLLTLIKTGQVDTVVAYHLDRLLRSNLELEQLIPLCEEHGVRIMTVSGDIDLSTDAGRLVGRILASVARGEVERKGRRQKDANLQGAAAGKPPMQGAFGHARVNRVNGERIPVPDEEIAREAEGQKTAYEMLFAGSSTRAIARWLNSQGFTTIRGGQWERSAVKVMLMNSRNAGIRTMYGKLLDVPGDWPAIVSVETWQAAVQILTDPARTRNHGIVSARKWLGGALYLCGQCNDSDMMTNYKGDKVRIYKCRAGKHNIRAAEAIDGYVLSTVAERLGRDDLAQLMLGPDQHAPMSSLKLRAATLRQRLNVGLPADYANEFLTAEQVRAASQQITAQLADVEDQLAEIGSRSRMARLLAAPNRVQEFLDGDLEHQRATISTMCTVTLLRNRRGRWALMEDTVRIDFRTAQ